MQIIAENTIMLNMLRRRIFNTNEIISITHDLYKNYIRAIINKIFLINDLWKRNGIILSYLSMYLLQVDRWNL